MFALVISLTPTLPCSFDSWVIISTLVARLRHRHSFTSRNPDACSSVRLSPLTIKSVPRSAPPGTINSFHADQLLIYPLNSTRTTIIAMTSTLSLSEPARDRIIRITNVHFKADAQFIVNMFDGFTIVDQMRTVNTRTGTNSVVYILFGTIADRIRSTELNGLTIVDREIKIQPAREGNFARKSLPPRKSHLNDNMKSMSLRLPSSVQMPGKSSTGELLATIPWLLTHLDLPRRPSRTPTFPPSARHQVIIAWIWYLQRSFA